MTSYQKTILNVLYVVLKYIMEKSNSPQTRALADSAMSEVVKELQGEH